MYSIAGTYHDCRPPYPYWCTATYVRVLLACGRSELFGNEIVSVATAAEKHAVASPIRSLRVNMVICQHVHDECSL